jgi:hypothetical protein
MHSSHYLGIFFCCALLGCKFGSPDSPRSRGIKVTESLEQTLDQGLVAIVRNKERVSASLSFETADSSSCEVGFQDSKTFNPKSFESISFKSCSSPQPGRIFSELIENLDPNIKYTFVVRSWSSNQKPTDAKSFVIKEVDQPCQSSDGALLRLRVDHTLKTGAADCVEANDPIEGWLNSRQTEASCTLIPKKADGFFRPLDGAHFKKIKMFGSIKGGSPNSPSPSGYSQLDISSSDLSQSEWSTVFLNNGTSSAVQPTLPGLIKSAKVTQGSLSSARFSSTLEESDTPPLNLSRSLNTVIEWDLSQNNSRSMAVVILTTQSDQDSIQCQIPANKGRIDIPQALLTKLKANQIALLFKITSSEFLSEQRSYVEVNDWRAIQILL